jgi:Ni/Fe-hydrogenase subunit HybB-like protein
VMSLRRTALPSAWGNYSPTLWDWLTLFGTVGLFAAGVLICIRLLPMISMFEMRELIARRAQVEADRGE